ncbi:MAG: peptidoglycan DD-metalloendopeptidase family protein [Rhodocyclaceae bacterium]
MSYHLVSVRLGAASLLVSALLLGGCASNVPAPVVERAAQPAALPAVPLAGKEVYTVKKGDTLYSIALDQGLDYKELAAWNNIDNPNRILIGQSLRVKAAGAADVAVAKPVVSGALVENRSLDGNGSSNSDGLKREPKAGKEPYSDQALALALAQGQQKPLEAVTPAAMKPEPKPELKPEVKPESKSAEPAVGGDEFVWLWPASGKTIATFSEGASKGVDIAGKAGDPVLAAGDGKVVYSGTGLRGYGKLVIVKHNGTYLSAYAHNQSVLVKEGQAVSKGQKIAEMGSSDADQVKLHFEVRRLGKPVDPLKYLPQR